MAKALDIGTGYCVAAYRNEEKKVTYKRCRTAFFKISNSMFVSNMLEQSKVPFIIKGNDVIVTSEDALDFAILFKSSVNRPLAKGLLNPYEKESLPILQLLFETILGKPATEKELLVYSIPAPSVDIDNDVVYHSAMLKALLEDLGYTAIPLNEGLAIVYSELIKNRFIGFGISMGAGLVNVCLSHLGKDIFSFSIGKAGDWIDAQVAKSQGMPISKVTKIKETQLNLKEDQTDIVLRSLKIYYQNLIEYCIKNMKKYLEETKNTPDLESVPIVIAGGTSMPQGVAELFRDELAKVEFPVKISEVIHANEPFYANVRGCLVFAESTEKKKIN